MKITLAGAALGADARMLTVFIILRMPPAARAGAEKVFCHVRWVSALAAVFLLSAPPAVGKAVVGAAASSAPSAAASGA